MSLAGMSVIVLSGAIVWDVGHDGFWSRHALLTDVVGSFIVVAVSQCATAVTTIPERLLAPFGDGGRHLGEPLGPPKGPARRTRWRGSTTGGTRRRRPRSDAEHTSASADAE